MSSVKPSGKLTTIQLNFVAPPPRVRDYLLSITRAKIGPYLGRRVNMVVFSMSLFGCINTEQTEFFTSFS